MMLVASKKKVVYVPTVHTKTFAFNESFVVPVGVTAISMIGHGGPGTPGYDYYDDYYSINVKTYNQRNDLGGQIIVVDQGTTYNHGPVPADYCEDPTPYQTSGGVTNYTWNCYHYVDRGSVRTVPGTTGASATGFGKVFPGGYGGAASDTQFPSVTVTALASYPVVVPSGGSITISYKV